MKVIITHEGFPPGAHEGIKETIEHWTQAHLEPVLTPFRGEKYLYATVHQHVKGEARYRVKLRMHLPRKHLLVAHAEHPDIHAALAKAEERLLNEVKKHKERLRKQADCRRKARRLRLHELKALQPSVEVAAQARNDMAALLPRLERVVRRELAYLRYNGALPADSPTVQDVVDEAVLTAIGKWQPAEPDVVLQRLFKAAFNALDHEIESRSRHGELASLESAPEPDATDQAEAMVEEEIFEFYQPDEALLLSDVLPDENATLPESELELARHEYSVQALTGLPDLWRRVWMLSEYERLSPEEIAAVLEVELARVEDVFGRVGAFFRDHFQQLGLI